MLRQYKIHKQENRRDKEHEPEKGYSRLVDYQDHQAHQDERIEPDQVKIPT